MDLRERVLQARPDLDDPLLRRALASLSATVLSATTRRLGRYRLIRRLGGGGFGTVWLAFDPLLSREVAIKILHRDLGGAELLHMQREAQTLAGLSHPNVVACFDIGVDGETPYMAMQYVDGCDLATWLADDRTPRELLRVFAEAAAGLAAGHAVGVVHRDVKPANILIPRRGPAQVTDFGVARASAVAVTLAGDDQSTQATNVAGTPLYMAPEQMMGRTATAASDVFSLAATLYEAFAGVPAFAGLSHAELVEHKLAGTLIPPLRGRAVPSRVWDAVLAGLDPDPRRRPSATQMIRNAMPPTARSRALLTSLGVAVPLLAFAAAPAADDPCAAKHLAVPAIRLPEELGAAVEARRAALDEARGTACTAFADGAIARNQLHAQLTCLDQRGRDLTAFTDALVSSDAAIGDAMMGLAALPAQEGCAGETTAIDGGDPESVRARLMFARAVGRRDSDSARREATAVLAIAEAEGRTALQAEALVQRGMASFVLLDGEPAIADLHRAYWLATGLGDDRIAAEAAVWLVGVVGRIDGADKAEPWERHAEAALDRLTNTDALRAWLELHRSANAVSVGHVVAATDAGKRMLALWQRSAPDGPALVLPWLQYAMILRSSDRLDEALAAAEEARRRIDPDQDRRGDLKLQVRMVVASVWYDQGRINDAAAEFRDILPKLTAVLGTADARVASTRSNLARVLAASGQFAEAREQQTILLEQAERTLGADHLQVAKILADIGYLEMRSDEEAAAREHLMRATVIFEGLPTTTQSLPAYTALAELAADLDQRAEVVRWMSRAKAVVDETLPADHHTRISVGARSWLARATGSCDPADFAGFIELRGRVTNTMVGASLDTGVAAAYRGCRDPASAERFDRAAVAVLIDDGPRRDLARARYSLANSLDALGRDPAEVMQLRRDACATFRDPAAFDGYFDTECTKLGITDDRE